MSIQGIHSAYSAPVYAPQRGRAAPDAVVRPQVADAGAPANDVRRSLPAEVPAGTDSTLWGVLTSDERSFFARATSSGAATYGPGASAPGTPSVSLGGRIDLKV